MVQRTLTDQTEHTLLTRFDVWYRKHLLIKQSIHFQRDLMYGTENTTDQTERTLLTRVGVWYREHLLIKQSMFF